MMKNRRTFIKTAAAGVGISLIPAKFETISAAETKTVSGGFEILGIKGFVFLEVQGDDPGVKFEVSVTPIDGKKALARIRLKPQKQMAVNKFSVRLNFPLVDIHRIWYTQQKDGLGWETYVSLPWGSEIKGAGNEGSFIAGLQNRYGINRGLFALKNQTGDGSIQFATEYGKSKINLTINRFAPGYPFKADEIDETVYLDLEDKSWFDAVSNFVEWYDKEHDTKLTTPEFAYEPAFNSWYALFSDQKEFDLLRLAKKCAEIGFKTFEIDAGWFIDEGDYKPRNDFNPDFRKTVQNIRSLGMKTLAWYRPFYMNESFPAAKEWGKYLVVADGKKLPFLCPRCKEVRERGARLASEIMQKYSLDGLKIDFLDVTSENVPLVNCQAGHIHDYDFVSDGARETMRMMAESIRAVKPDALIEYRLGYANIANRPFATISRGQDAPDDPDHVRRHLTLLRSWSRGVAVHADYPFWSPEESPENVSKILASEIFYAVPTLSVDFDKLPENHIKLIKSWISFYHTHKKNFLDGKFEPLSNDPHYSVVRVSAKGATYIPAFLECFPSVLQVVKGSDSEIYLYNGTAMDRIVTELDGVSDTYLAEITDKFLAPAGKTMTVKSAGGNLALNIPVEVGGIVKLRRV
jgi:alpha-galactosidase